MRQKLLFPDEPEAPAVFESFRKDLIESISEDAKKSGGIAFDVEHSPNISPYNPGFLLHGVSVATENYCEYLSSEEFKVLWQSCLEYPDLDFIAHNAKSDLVKLMAVGIADSYHLPQIFCTMVAQNLLNENLYPNQLGLKYLVKMIFDHDMVEFESVCGNLNSKEFMDYSREDAKWTYRLWKKYKPELIKENLWNLFTKIRMKALCVFADMELVGIKWDIKKGREINSICIKIRDDLLKELREEFGHINFSSPKQVGKLLFEDLGIATDSVKLTSTGKYSTDAETLEKLARIYPTVNKIISYRTAAKMSSTYCEPMNASAEGDPNSRLHPNYWLVSTSGRTRSDNPNIQNFPNKIDSLPGVYIRSAFIARDGFKLVAFDYSQIELRYVAHFSKDQLFLRAYNDWCCTNCGSRGSSNKILHNCPNCGIGENEDILKNPEIKGFWHGLDLHAMTAEIPALRGDRSSGKAANFALVYQATAKTMHQHYPLFSVKQWKEVIQQYFHKYAGVKLWHLAIERRLNERRVFFDVFGHKRRIPEKLINTRYKNALNMATNFGPQASACNMALLAYVRIKDFFVKNGLWLKDVFPVAFIHDELLWEIRNDKLKEISNEIQNIMENVVQLRVPVRTGCKVGDNWAQCK